MTHLASIFLVLSLASNADGNASAEAMLNRASAMLAGTGFRVPEGSVHNLKFVVHDWKRQSPFFTCGVFAATAAKNFREGDVMDVRASVVRVGRTLWVLAVYRDEKGRKGRFAEQVDASLETLMNEAVFAHKIAVTTRLEKEGGTSLNWDRYDLQLNEAVFTIIFGDDFSGRNVTVVPSYWE